MIFLPLWACAEELTVPYEVAIKGVNDSKLLKELESVSDAISLKDRPPASMPLLRIRAERDEKQFMQMLRAMGYYSAGVGTDLDTAHRPVQVVFHVTMGPLYTIRSFDLGFIGGAEVKALDLPRPGSLGLAPGSPFRSEVLLDAEKKLLEALGRKGFPSAKIADRKVIVDHADHTVAGALRVDSGPRASFGPVEIAGLESTHESIVRRKIPWVEGTPFNADLLTALQKDLVELGLFSTVRVSHGETSDEAGMVPVTITVKERKYRSIATGVSYRTDEKVGLKFSWENRNLFGEGERLGLTGTVSSFTYAAEAGFRKPFFFREDQALVLASRLAEDKPDAYTSINLANSALLVRDVTKTLKIGGGLGFKQANVSQLGKTDDFSLLSLPLQLAWDRSNNLLDPSAGGRLSLQLAPYKDLFKEDLQFLKSKGGYIHYLKILDSPSIVLAGRVNMGVVGGEERLEIPADERLYAGGGGSVRGYSYQSLGPHADSIPTGGKSLLEVSFENRLRITEKIGMAFFIDGGNSFAETTPSSDESLLWGAGVGIRYFTPIGPFRFDIGVPLNRREGVDDAFQIYVSLGQAF